MVQTTIGIDGMMCGMCEAHINDAIRNNFDVKKVTASHTKRNAVVLSEEPLDEDKLKSVIDETGYEFLSVRTEENVKRGLFGRK